jgi:hypothetical protein
MVALRNFAKAPKNEQSTFRPNQFTPGSEMLVPIA